MKLIADVSKNTIEHFDSDGSTKVIYFGFTDNDSLPVEFCNVRFGFSVFLDGALLIKKTYPPTGLVYEKTDQEFLVAFDVYLVHLGKTYQVTAWVENNKTYWQSSFDWIVPTPPSPYDSWDWSDKDEAWFAPVPYPSDGGNYVWNEDAQDWQAVTD